LRAREHLEQPLALLEKKLFKDKGSSLLCASVSD
jgi:hypothetical protein